MTDTQRTVDDLEGETRLYRQHGVSGGKRRAHFDADCDLLKRESNPTTAAQLFDDTPVCKACDPAVDHGPADEARGAQDLYYAALDADSVEEIDVGGD